MSERADTPAKPGSGISLSEYIDEHREELEQIAEGEYPISPVLASWLAKADQGNL